MLNVSNVAYFIAIGLHLLVLLLAICRILSVKAKRIIDIMQMTALIYYYRFQFEGTAQHAL